MKLSYDLSDKNSIITFAKQLVGKSVQSEFGEELLKLSLSNKDKGQLGKVIEELYFNYKPNSIAKADFEKAGLELKSSGLNQLLNKEYRAKERLVLSIINYLNVVNEDFEQDFLEGKNGHLLLIFYLYTKGLNQLASEIKLVGDWKYPKEDIEVIKQDWLKITQKIKDGKAHELSEGDTFYLGACTKGASSKTTRKQPNNTILAKQRAFSLKQGYVNHIIAKISGKSVEVYGKIIKPTDEIHKKSLEEIIIEKFKIYYGKNVEEITNSTGVNLNFNSKDFYSKLTHAILNINQDKAIEEFEKANIEIKTIRVEKNNIIKQSVSFPAFKFEQIYNENWVTSEMKDQIEKKYLFIFFRNNGDSFSLEKVKFWNMPLHDRNEVRKVWLKTKRIIQKGTIFKDFKKNKNGTITLSKKGNQVKLNNFPKMSDNPICHVRPHGQDSTETYSLPVMDLKLKVNQYSKQSFWLKNTYIRDKVYLEKY